MRVGTKVVKPRGYPFPGTVVARFVTLAGDTRLVVESELAPGMLHIFSPGQLELAFEEQPCPKCRHSWKNHEQEIVLTGTTLFECNAYAGMGDWCGCGEEIPDGED